MLFESFFKQLLKDIKIAVTDEFDQNFERKAFFDQPWPPEKYPAKKGSMMARTNKLRRSIKDVIQGDAIHWTSSEVYAGIQNDGGEITVTAKMKRYFWAMYYEAAGQIQKRKDGTARATKANTGLQVEAQYWKAMALMKVGSKIKIPARKFIGTHPVVDRIVREETDRTVQEIGQQLFQNLKP